MKVSTSHFTFYLSFTFDLLGPVRIRTLVGEGVFPLGDHLPWQNTPPHLTQHLRELQPPLLQLRLYLVEGLRIRTNFTVDF